MKTTEIKVSEPDFKCGGKETTQKQLLKRVKALKKKKNGTTTTSKS